MKGRCYVPDQDQLTTSDISKSGLYLQQVKRLGQFGIQVIYIMYGQDSAHDLVNKCDNACFRADKFISLLFNAMIFQ